MLDERTGTNSQTPNPARLRELVKTGISMNSSGFIGDSAFLQTHPGLSTQLYPIEAPPKRSNVLTRSEVFGGLVEYTRMLFPFDFNRPPPQSVANYPALPKFVDSIMRQTLTPLSTLVLALLYLRRLKEFHPSCRGSHGSSHRLLYTAVIIASKYTCDDTYDNKAWSTASIGLFGGEETNKMEREFLQYLDFKIFVTEAEWALFLGELGRFVKDLQLRSRILKQTEEEFIEFNGRSQEEKEHLNLLRQISSSSTFYEPEDDIMTTATTASSGSIATVNSAMMAMRQVPIQPQMGQLHSQNTLPLPPLPSEIPVYGLPQPNVLQSKPPLNTSPTAYAHSQNAQMASYSTSFPPSSYGHLHQQTQSNVISHQQHPQILRSQSSIQTLNYQVPVVPSMAYTNHGRKTVQHSNSHSEVLKGYHLNERGM